MRPPIPRAAGAAGVLLLVGRASGRLRQPGPAACPGRDGRPAHADEHLRRAGGGDGRSARGRRVRGGRTGWRCRLAPTAHRSRHRCCSCRGRSCAPTWPIPTRAMSSSTGRWMPARRQRWRPTWRGYLGSGLGQTNYPADTRFGVAVLGQTIVFTAFSPGRSSDRDRGEAIFEALASVGEPVEVAR